jgi:hypothetical protein
VFSKLYKTEDESQENGYLQVLPQFDPSISAKMKLTLLLPLYFSLNILTVLSQDLPEEPENPNIPEPPDGDIDTIIDFTIGIVDGVPLPGDLSDLNLTTPTGHTITQILMLNTTAQGGTNLIDPNDSSQPCHKW